MGYCRAPVERTDGDDGRVVYPYSYVLPLRFDILLSTCSFLPGPRRCISSAMLAETTEWMTASNNIVADGDSGLTAAVIESTVTPQQAADGLLAYVQKYIPQKGTALLAGNSVHADRAFLRKAPYNKVLDHLHYRILDVSSIKEAARRWW